MKDLYLIYINKIGKNYKGNYLYEFIFSDTIKDIDGENWDNVPASGLPEPPNEEFIKKVGRLESELRLDVIQDSDTFAIWDALDDIISLAWENIDDYESYPNKRLAFRFGENLKMVESKLYEKDFILDYKK